MTPPKDNKEQRKERKKKKKPRENYLFVKIIL
jgi:hypothetical protein